MASQTAASKRAESAIKEKWSGVRFEHDNCRRIDCKNPPCGWSQHSWNNALDIFGSTDKLDDLARWLTANSGQLAIKVLIWRERHHYDHIHIDFWPTGRGTPPCAGGSLEMQEGTGASINIAGENLDGGTVIPGETITGGGEPPIDSPAFAMSPDELSALGCATALQVGEAIVGAGAQGHLTEAQRAALKGRLQECASRPALITGLDTIFSDPGRAVDVALGPLDEFLAVLVSGETWVRVISVVGGGVLAIVAIGLLGKGFGVSVPSPARAAAEAVT